MARRTILILSIVTVALLGVNVSACGRFGTPGAAESSMSEDGGLASTYKSEASTPCTTDEECSSATAALPKCIDGKCVECIAKPEDSCGPGLYCLPTNQCATGCKDNQDCVESTPGKGLCDLAQHQCRECLDNSNCVAPKACTPSRLCADRCSAGGSACSNGQQCCGEFCVDMKTDPLNCGACGNKCGGSKPVCCDGKCQDAHSSVTNCGACGVECSAKNGTPSCVVGMCQWSCSAGYSHCLQGNTGCETPTSSADKCGGCNTNCNVLVKNATGIMCVAGTQCDYLACFAGSVDGDNNRANGCEPCGGVDQFCCPGPAQPCNTTDTYCAKDGKCRACKGYNQSCTGGVQGECCGGKICQVTKLCQ